MGTEVVPKTEEAVPAEGPSPIEQQIIRQIEYYFGNFNLCRDKFLREQLKLDDGWVSLETLITFNRLKKLSEDFTVITNALKKSPNQLIEINEDCTKIRRRVADPIPEDYDNRVGDLDKKTVYVKGFKKDNTLDELLEFFKDYKTEHVFMRRNKMLKARPFKGSVFATFETEDDAKKFLEMKGLKYNGVELLKESKKDYQLRKDEQYKSYREAKEKKLAQRAAIAEKAKEIEMVPGCLLKLTGLKGDISRENIKVVFDPLGTVIYIDYNRGNSSAVIRFESGIASSVLEKLNEEQGVRKVEINSASVEVTLIEGEEEVDYWKSIAISRAQSRLKFTRGQHRGNKGNQHKGFKGRFKKYGKRRGDDENDDGPSSKRGRAEDSEENGKESSSEQKEASPEASVVEAQPKGDS